MIIRARLSGQSAFEILKFLIGERVWFMVLVLGVASRFCDCSSVLRLALYGVKFVGLVKCLLKELSMSLFAVLTILLSFREHFGSVFVGFYVLVIL